jgi:hypothetical protein
MCLKRLQHIHITLENPSIPQPHTRTMTTMPPAFYPTNMNDARLAEYEFDCNVLDGIHAVIKTTQQRESCTWTYLRNNPPSDSTGYMFSDNPMFAVINGNMQVGHSGSSYAWTMRNLQYISSHGIDAYIAERNSIKTQTGTI